MYRKILIPIAVALLATGRAALADLDVVTTTTDLAAIAEAVGGDHVEAFSLTPGTRDPHYAEAKPSMIRRVHRADLFLAVGADLEIGWLPAVLRAGRNADVLPGATGFLDLSTAARLLDVPSGPVSRAMGDVHPRGNPHYWLDPENGRLMARAIAARLALLDPDGAQAYADGLAAFEAGLDRKLPDWRAALTPLRGRPVVAYHTSFRYLSVAFGFNIVDLVEPKPGIAPTASHLNGLVARIAAQDIGLLIVEPYYERRSSQFLSDKTGIRVAVVPQSVGAEEGIKTYFDLFDGVVAALGAREGP
jgi:zinc/manganese transport system substrate-binding protein